MKEQWTESLTKVQAADAVKLFQAIKKTLAGQDPKVKKAAIFLVGAALEVTENEQAPTGVVPIQQEPEDPKGPGDNPAGG
jgi:hypothetical protein